MKLRQQIKSDIKALLLEKGWTLPTRANSADAVYKTFEEGRRRYKFGHNVLKAEVEITLPGGTKEWFCRRRGYWKDLSIKEGKIYGLGL